jgi:hypothetical protein
MRSCTCILHSGQALADGSDTGSTAFKSTWGPLTISSDATFVTQAYTNVFAASGTAAQIQHFVDQLNFYRSIYTASGALGLMQMKLIFWQGVPSTGR